jgi:hypothetical protein
MTTKRCVGNSNVVPLKQKQCRKDAHEKRAALVKAAKYPLFPMDEDVCQWAIANGQL